MGGRRFAAIMIMRIVFPLLTVLAGLCLAGLSHLSLVHALLLAFLFVQVGLGGITHGVGHTLLSEMAARNIGWISNCFQKEVGFANLACGALGIASPWFGQQFWLATLIAFSIFFVGAGVVHIWDMRLTGNRMPGNNWWHIIFVCFFQPAAGWLLYALVERLG